MNNTAVEIERKYVILMPDFEKLAHYDGYECSEITQTYLSSYENVTRRVRKRVFADRTVYTETSKRRIDRLSAFEDEREIGEEEYEACLSEMAPGSTPVRKHRHVIYYSGACFEIDVYAQWQRSCIMETELSHRDETVKMPPDIRVIAEVTGDKKYSNAAMSRSFPKELV